MIKLSTYLLLIGAASAQTVPVCATITDAEALATPQTALSVKAATDAAPAQEYATAKMGFEADVAKATFIAQVTKLTQNTELITPADQAVVDAQAALDTYIAADGNAALQTLLDTLATEMTATAATDKAVNDAINACNSTDIVTYMTTTWEADQKAFDAYVDMSVIDKGTWDLAFAAFKAEVKASFVMWRSDAGYHNFTDAQKILMNKVLLDKLEDMLAMKDDISVVFDYDGLNKAAWDDLTVEQQAAANKLYGPERLAVTLMLAEFTNTAFDFRNKADYYTQEKSAYDRIDKYIEDRIKTLPTEVEEALASEKADRGTDGYDALTVEQKADWDAARKMRLGLAAERSMDTWVSGFKNRIATGYFQMSGEDRKTFEDWETADQENITTLQDAMHLAIANAKTAASYDAMTAEEQKAFTNRAMWQIGDLMNMMQKNRKSDLEIMIKGTYWEASPSGRTALENEVTAAKNARVAAWTPLLKGAIGSKCMPLSQMQEDGSWANFRTKLFGDMMDTDMDAMMKDDDDMFEKGMSGEDGMKEKFGDLQDMLDELTLATETEDTAKLGNFLHGMMTELITANPDAFNLVLETMGKNMMMKMKQYVNFSVKMGGKEGMAGKDGMEGGMEKVEGEEPAEKPEDLFLALGGKYGLMDLMGMTAGSNKAAFDTAVTAFEAQEKPDGKTMRDSGDLVAHNDGCGDAENLCCGQVQMFGVWSQDWQCNTKTAVVLDGMTFQCAELATQVAAGAMSLIAAAFMMA